MRKKLKIFITILTTILVILIFLVLNRGELFNETQGSGPIYQNEKSEIIFYKNIENEKFNQNSLLMSKIKNIVKKFNNIINIIEYKINNNHNNTVIKLTEVLPVKVNLAEASINYQPKFNGINNAKLWDGKHIYYPNITTPILSHKKGIPKIEEQPKNRISSAAWLNVSDTNIREFTKSAMYFDHVHPFLYDIVGNINNRPIVSLKRNSEAIRNMVSSIREANPNILILPTIFRWETANRLEINQVIGIGENGEEIMMQHIESLIERTHTYDFDGMDIDYEGMPLSKEKYFTNFVRVLREEIDKYNIKHNKNILLSLSVHPKTWASNVVRDSCIIQMGFQGNKEGEEVEEAKESFSNYTDSTSFRTARSMTVGTWKTLSDTEKTNFCRRFNYRDQWRGPQAHNYYDLAKYADYIKIMAYEKFPMFGEPGPGPQAPLYWVNQITQYAYDHIPSEKVFIGLPTYGYQRPIGGDCSGVTRAVFWDNFSRISDEFEYPTRVLRPEDPNWENYDILRQYNIAYAHSRGGAPIEYYEPAIWYEEDGCYKVAFTINKEAFQRKVEEVMKYPVGGFSMWQFTTRNDKNIVKYIEDLMREKMKNEILKIKIKDDNPTYNRYKNYISK